MLRKKKKIYYKMIIKIIVIFITIDIIKYNIINYYQIYCTIYFKSLNIIRNNNNNNLFNNYLKIYQFLLLIMQN